MASRQVTINVSPAQSPRTFGPVDVPERFSQIEFRFGNWPQANRTLGVVFEISADGGTTWANFGGMNPTPGNRSVGRDGTTDAVVRFEIPDEMENVSLRAIATAAGGQVSSLVTITAT